MLRLSSVPVLLMPVMALVLMCGPASAQSWEDVLDVLTGDSSSTAEEVDQEADEHEVPGDAGLAGIDSVEAGFALKEALLVGAEGAVEAASRREGFLADPEIRISLPDRLEKGRSTLLRFGLADEVDSLELSMNRAAESAATEALPALRDAVRDLVFDDPLATLGAGGSAATEVLRTKAREQIAGTFGPTARTHVVRRGVIRDLARLQDRGGNLVAESGVDRELLTRHVIDGTVDGLLTLIARSERAIRTDPTARTSPVLARAFGAVASPEVQTAGSEPVGAGPDQGDERHRALRQALSVGARRAVERASKTDGFFGNPAIHIALPHSVEKLGRSLRDIGLGQVVDELELSLNRAAERAAAEATPILLDAVTSVTFEDVVSILTGGDTAATEALRARTEGRLAEVFQPIIEDKMAEVGVTRSYERLVERAGPFLVLLGGDESQDLSGYVTGKTLDGLFTLVAEEEKKIREDPAARTTALLQQVFGQK